MENALRTRLLAGDVCFNGWLSIANGYSAEVMARAGWDSVTIDLQHGVQDYQGMVHCLQAVAAFPVTPLVRVATNEPGMVGKALDAGAWGIICPMVNTPDDASAFARACLYPPRGARSNGPNRAAAYGESTPYQGLANDRVLVLPMIETAEAVSNLESILDVPGVSGVYVGPSDLALSRGMEPKFDLEDDATLAIYATIVRETARRGQVAGIHTIGPAYAGRMAEMGFRLVTIGSDASLLLRAARDALAIAHSAAASGGALKGA
ncbi:2,4-dihydroxyhept-2-ene-1,7-dioic acid aldolase [Mesorhizobium sp. CU2]|uniref:HpcH/HpaI aldolase family protein n=1 Tax=unclassified Mesorhizobium TaxID=325217 RepID=UPI001128C969|nr:MULTISPECIES: aldolase/citrate lyase family protein [unclassified Mesorhizobium]TPN81089.1 2,4-dihydroxyhept-2-ene-1,7-dioic acid aldolase [Mesorhizobium sp. CU3]TPO11690.1 2,4-dihydroxyhept-2-ene-1,7-dioic acid aldolase [Mesorhizobium sp. CU2]